jgi:hypothetical protein
MTENARNSGQGGDVPDLPTPSEQSGLSVAAGWKWGKLAATGPYAGAAASAIALIVFLCVLEPMTNVKHFLLVMLACVVGGAFFGHLNAASRMLDALRSKEEFRDEMRQLAKRNQELQDLILQRRISSADQGEPPRAAALLPPHVAPVAPPPEAAPEKTPAAKPRRGGKS